MKQTESNDCMAATAAMITGTTLNEAKQAMKQTEDGYFSFPEVMLYCAKHGLTVGDYALDLPPVSVELGKVEFSYSIKIPALVVVETFAGPVCNLHALYWDGNMVHDPSPAQPDGLPLHSYRIRFWWPIVQNEGLAQQIVGLTARI